VLENPGQAGGPAPGRGLGGDLTQYPVGPLRPPGAALGADRQEGLGLSLGASMGVAVRPDGADTWQVVQVRRDEDPVRLGDTLPLPSCAGLAEKTIAHLGVARLVEAKRRGASTGHEKQTALLRKPRIAGMVRMDQSERRRMCCPRCWGLD